MDLTSNSGKRLLERLINMHKPNEVSKIDFSIIDYNGYHLNLYYVVPDDSPHLTYQKVRDKRWEWNEQIKNAIANYLNTNVKIGSTNVYSESFYEKTKSDK